MNKKFLYAAITTLVVFNGFLVFSSWKSPENKIAYVRTQHLVDNYLGMKEARTKYQNMETSWQSSLDTLKLDYQKALTQYNSANADMSQEERVKHETLLQKQYENISGYANMLDEKAKAEDDRLTRGVLSQVDSYINDFGKANGYDLIIGVTNAGNVLYGDEAIDITEDILKKLNDNYQNGNVAEN